MPRGKSNRGDNRGDQSIRGGRQNISSRRGSTAMDDDERRTSTKGGRASRGGDRGINRGRTSEDSNRSE